MQKVLVVDDEHICSYFLGRSLEQEGFEVKTATRGDEAVEIAQDFKPDVLVSDWMLRDVYSGLDVARLMHRDNPNLKIIFITGMAADALLERADGVPIIEVMEKPVDIDDLLRVIRLGSSKERAEA